MVQPAAPNVHSTGEQLELGDKHNIGFDGEEIWMYALTTRAGFTLDLCAEENRIP